MSAAGGGRGGAVRAEVRLWSSKRPARAEVDDRQLRVERRGSFAFVTRRTRETDEALFRSTAGAGAAERVQAMRPGRDGQRFRGARTMPCVRGQGDGEVGRVLQ